MGKVYNYLNLIAHGYCIDSIIDIDGSELGNFFNLLSSPFREMLLVCGDLNGHVRKTSSG